METKVPSITRVYGYRLSYAIIDACLTPVGRAAVVEFLNAQKIEIDRAPFPRVNYVSIAEDMAWRIINYNSPDRIETLFLAWTTYFGAPPTSTEIAGRVIIAKKIKIDENVLVGLTDL